MAKVLLDTNVWLDYHCGRDLEDRTAFRVLDGLLSESHQILITPMILKDVYYLIGSVLKRGIRAGEQGVSTETATAINEIAWGCIQQMLEIAEVVDIGVQDCRQAVTFRSVREDFEDNLMLACAQTAAVDYFVTSDKRLLAHAKPACISPKEMIEIMNR